MPSKTKTFKTWHFTPKKCPNSLEENLYWNIAVAFLLKKHASPQLFFLFQKDTNFFLLLWWLHYAFLIHLSYLLLLTIQMQFMWTKLFIHISMHKLDDDAKHPYLQGQLWLFTIEWIFCHFIVNRLYIWQFNMTM